MADAKSVLTLSKITRSPLQSNIHEIGFVHKVRVESCEHLNEFQETFLQMQEDHDTKHLNMVECFSISQYHFGESTTLSPPNQSNSVFVLDPLACDCLLPPSLEQKIFIIRI